MMRKMISWLSILTVFLTLFSSCQQELLQTGQEYGAQLQENTVQRLRREDLERKYPQVMDKLKKLKPKSLSSNNRIYTDTENDFSINTDETYIVKDANGTITYTFKIERKPESEEGTLENLILKDLGEGNFFAYFIKYDAAALGNSREKPLSPEELSHHISLYAAGRKTASEIFGKLDSCPMVFYTVGSYVYVDGQLCKEGLHSYGQPCAYLGTSGAATQGGYQVVYSITMQESGGGCGPGGFEPSSGSGTMGTTPTHGGIGGNLNLPELDDVTDPCNNLKKLLNPAKANLKPLITNNMYNYINSNSPGETGIFIKKDSNGNISTELPAPSPTNHLPTPTGPNYFSGVHTHPKTTYPILSYDDIYTLHKLDQNTGAHNAGQASVVMVCEDDSGVKQTYAIVFESPGQTLQQIWNNPENIGCPIKDLIDILSKKLEKLYNEEEEKTNPNYERVFLQFTFGDNIGLYKANNDLTNWSKLTIIENSETAIVTSTDCN